MQAGDSPFVSDQRQTPMRPRSPAEATHQHRRPREQQQLRKRHRHRQHRQRRVLGPVALSAGTLAGVGSLAAGSAGGPGAVPGGPPGAAAATLPASLAAEERGKLSVAGLPVSPKGGRRRSVIAELVNPGGGDKVRMRENRLRLRTIWDEASVAPGWKSRPTTPLEANPISQFYEIGRQTASAGPELIWKIYDAQRKSDKRVSAASGLLGLSPGY
ncbi:hypothetical protein HPB48_006394 [Haemaphysalis longicornis]|uniref:Uncharacterized protein n=1 Tax=Haemaphysalis longicornis TaxID=44386 RepID=A0A9J6FLK4_HAELO|nr:hypothetical protein HPB48_006394 [Haemaphysalis longicornis]